MKYNCMLQPWFAPVKFYEEKDINGFNKFGYYPKRALYYTVIVPDFEGIDVSKINMESYFDKCKTLGLNTSKYSLFDVINNIDNNGYTPEVANKAKIIVKNVIKKCYENNVKLPSKNLFEGKLPRDKWYPYHSYDAHYYFEVDV